MVTRTFLSKCNTIFKDSSTNFGLNPIGMLNYGNLVSRTLIFFDTDKIEKLIEEGYSPESMKHTLRMTNCGSIDNKRFPKPVRYNALRNEDKRRATSFDIVYFKVPKFWDRGRGFDNALDYWFIGDACVSTEGSNWYNSTTAMKWRDPDVDGTEFHFSSIPVEDGIYSSIALSEECDKFREGNSDIIVGIQHFDYGNEDFELDLTDYVNEIITGSCENFGLCLAFDPSLELKKEKNSRYVGFFTNCTNTFFKPVLETRIDDAISDDRYSFTLNRTNNLYFFSIVDGVYRDLDELPVCEICGKEREVKRVRTGVYCAEVKLTKDEASVDDIIYDTWSNLKFNGDDIDDVEQEFVILGNNGGFSSTISQGNKNEIIASLIGINDNEKVYQGDDRKVEAIFKKKYTNQYELAKGAYYRLYVKDGKREIDVIDWDGIDSVGKYNAFMIKSEDLLPAEYYIDVKATVNGVTRIFKDKLHFKIVENVTDITK